MRTGGDVLLKSLVDSLPFAVWVLGSSLKVRLWNKTAEQLFQWPARDVVGRAHPTVPEDKYDEFVAAYELALSGRKVYLNTVRQRKDRRPLRVNVVMCPLQEDEGRGSVLIMCEPLGVPETAMMGEQTSAVNQVRKVEVKAGMEALTPREREIVELLVARGDSTRALAQRLQIREQVVRNYLHRIYRQLHVASRSELIALLSN
jgi:PAS domain S-box-containing protein